MAGPGRGRLLGTAVLVVAVFLLAAVATVYWFEGEKEVRILCGVLPAGAPRAEVIRVLDTANLLEVHSDTGDRTTARRVTFTSRWNARTTACSLELDADGVANARFTRSWHLERVAAFAALPLLLGLAVLQVALASGAPLGHLAWGGTHRVLPPHLRVASGVAAPVLVAVGWILLERAGLTGLLADTPVADAAAWTVFLLFLFSTLGNLASRSTPERRLGIPVALALTLLSLVVAYSG